MLLIAIALGVLAGLFAGGRITNLLSIQLRYGFLIVAALLLRIVTQWLLDQGVDIVEQFRLPLFALSFGALTFALWLNRSQPGLLLAMIGVAFNGIAIALNGGAMPVYVPALEIAGMTEAELSPTFHTLLPSELGAEFLLRVGPLGDVLPLAIPYLENVISLGDVISAVITALATLALFRFKAGVMPLLATCAAAGLAITLLFPHLR